MWGEMLSERVLSEILSLLHSITVALGISAKCLLLAQLGISLVILLKPHPKDCGFQNLKVPRRGGMVSGLNAKLSSRFVLLPSSHAVIVFDLCRKGLLSTVLK